MPPSHSDLVRIGARWLFNRSRQKCSVVVTELASTEREEPDVLGWWQNTTILLECKATRADFLGDKKKSFRRKPGQGMGCRRYFLTPPGLVQPEEVPEGWGLLEAKGKRVYRIKEGTPFRQRNKNGEHAILLSCLKRLGKHAPDGVSIRYYTLETQCRATLGIHTEEEA